MRRCFLSYVPFSQTYIPWTLFKPVVKDNINYYDKQRLFNFGFFLGEFKKKQCYK